METENMSDFKNISSAKVLIVDDNKHNQELFSKFLEVMNITEIKCADDGTFAIDMMAKEDFDLVILDFVMPNMNGEEFLYKIRAVPQFKDIPVIVQTGENTAEVKEKMFKAGATDFVTKPVSPLEFLSRVQVHLENKMLIKELNKEIQKMSDNMALVKRMQESLFPDKVLVDSLQNIYNLRFSNVFEICDRIGGSFWDIVKIDENKFILILGEASGYGIPTSMNVFRTKTLIDDVEAPIEGVNIGKYMADINERLQPMLLRGQYVAVICMMVDIQNNKIYYTNAGYQSPLIKTKDGDIQTFIHKANPLGIAKNTTYTTEEVSFNSGDTVYIYGNLIINGKNKDGEALGIEGIKNSITKYTVLSDFIKDFKASVPNISEFDFTGVTFFRH